MITSPVFLYEAITASRRWQGYALRAFLVLAFLIVLAVVWFGRRQGAPTNIAETRQFLSKLGENFYYGCAGIQLALVLLAAPAATAGAVCVDRARGWLAHMFVTDLSDAEIVLGKLMARLASVVVLVFASLPALAIVSLLGGIIPEALVNLTVVTLAMLLLGCSLALAFSVRALRTHDALMVVLALWTFWLLSAPLWDSATRTGLVRRQPEWFYKLNPFVLVYAPYTRPGYVVTRDVAIFVGVACLVSGATLIYTIRHLRVELSPGGESSRVRVWLGWFKANLFSWWPSPSLDANPVLWREWHRNRPSRMARLVSGLFVAGTTLGMGIGIADAVNHGAGVGGDLLEGIGLYSVTFGLLILSARAPTSLTEERVRGSLDILLTTPLPTHVIVLSKWWATYRSGASAPGHPRLDWPVCGRGLSRAPAVVVASVCGSVLANHDNGPGDCRTLALGLSAGTRGRHDEPGTAAGGLVSANRPGCGRQRGDLRRGIDRLGHRNRDGNPTISSLVVDTRIENS